MDESTQRWVGYLRGSRTGTLFLNASTGGDAVLVIGFAGAGDLRLILERRAKTENIQLLLEGSREPFGSAVVEKETDDLIKGSWRFLSGAEGLFELSRDRTDLQQAPSAFAPDHIRNREVPLGAITLYRSDLERLIAEMESLVLKPSITTIRAVEGEQIVVEPSDKYLIRKDYVDVVRSMTISTTEVTSAPLKKIATVVLNDDGSSQIIISSPDEIWTEAVAIRLTRYANQFSSRFTGILRKHGLNINSFILIAIIIWMPDRPLVERIAVFSVGLVLMFGIVKSHSLLPYNRVYLDPDRQKKPFSKEIPGASMAAAAGIVTAGLSAAPQIFQAAKKIVESFVTWLWM